MTIDTGLIAGADVAATPTVVLISAKVIYVVTRVVAADLAGTTTLTIATGCSDGALVAATSTVILVSL